jgi:hypothetical protein
MLCIDGDSKAFRAVNRVSDSRCYRLVLAFHNRCLFHKITDITGTILFYGKLLNDGAFGLDDYVLRVYDAVRNPRAHPSADS